MREWVGAKPILCAFIALSLAGCVTGVVDEIDSAKCPDPVQGERYSICGRLSASGIDNQGAAGKRALATVDSAQPSTSSSRYSVQGASFHAHR